MSNSQFSLADLASNLENIDPSVRGGGGGSGSGGRVDSSASAAAKGYRTTNHNLNNRVAAVGNGMASSNGTAESDSGYSVTPSDFSPPMSGGHSSSYVLGSGDGLFADCSEAGPDILDDEFRPASEVFRPASEVFRPASEVFRPATEVFRPATEVFRSAGAEPADAAEPFKDPNAFAFLSQHGRSDPEAGAAAAVKLARESLYVKFDPLVGGRPSVMNLLQLQQESSRTENDGGGGGEKHDLMAMNSPAKSCAAANESGAAAPQPLSDSRDASDESSAAAANETATNTTLEDSRDYDTYGGRLDAHAILEFQENLLKRDRQLTELQRQVDSRTADVAAMRAELQAKRDSEYQMKQVLKEYEKTISELIAEKEREREGFDASRRLLCADRDQAVEDLQNVETAFNDVHRKYERTKQVVEGFKSNEETLKVYVSEYQEKLRSQDQKYELLKSHAEETLEKANTEIEKMSRSQDAEMARLTAMLKKCEMKASGLDRAVEAKVKENEELTAICDELIAKVGRS